ncbi:MAG: sulfatase-like hydrolase/transferase [Chloroflexota bacterium]|nr:sulfatase-like hydrolase/transferase [Chloroflexota bacterium]
MNQTPSRQRRPNIIVILTDDQGPWALGCAGNREIRTPNLDRLAASGVRFSSFFCASPVCSPARASLLTGRIPSAHGVHDWLRDGNGGKQRPIEYLAGLDAYTDLLARAGYRCGLSGKWHLGDSPRPQKSFTHWYVHQTGGGPYYNAPMIRDGQLIQQPGYVTDAITDEALAYLDACAPAPGAPATDGAPFYLSVHYTAPHSPWVDNHPPEIVASYDDCPFDSCPDEPPHPWAIRTAPSADGARAREQRQGYFAAVTAMDGNVGRILDRLDSLGLRQDTLIFFLSDNGFNLGHHGIWGKGNGTFPQNMYDNSVKVPCIISHPGAISAGAVSDALLSQYDWFPTILDLAGVPHPATDSLPGRSFAPLLHTLGSTGAEGNFSSNPPGQAPSAAAAGRQYVVAGHVYDEYGPVRMVRTTEWKYVHRYAYGPHELYHLREDPDERANLVDDPTRAAVRRELKGELDDWFTRYADPLRDGTREAVYGKGQIDLAGPAGRGAKAYADDVTPVESGIPK